MLLARFALVLTAALLALPAVASAEPAFYEVEYAVGFEATANWKIDRTDQSPSGTTKDTWTVESETKLRGTLENITFRNGQLLNEGVPFAFATQENSGGGTSKHEAWDPTEQRWITTTGTCTALPQPLPPGQIALGRDASAGAVNGAALVARFADSPLVQFGCPKTSNTGAVLSDYAAFPAGTFDARFTLPAEAIGMGTIIQHVSGRSDQQSPAWCPGARNDATATTRSCEFTWSGKLTFTRTAEYQYNGDLYAPVNPTPGMDPRAEAIAHAVAQYGKDNPTPVDPRAEAVAHAVAQYGKDVPFDPRADAISRAVEQYGKELQFEASCPAGCTGTAEILPGGGGKAKPRAYAAATRVLAKLRFRVAPGKRRKVRIVLPAKARKALERAGKASVRITLVPRGAGKPVTRVLPLRTR